MSAQQRMFAPSDKTLISRARARLEGRGIVEDRLLSDPVARSWQRCLALQLDPLGHPNDVVVDGGTLGRLLHQHSVLRALARPELEQLFRQVSGSNYMLALGTPEGIVTDVLADTSFLETQAGKIVIEGSVWSEGLRGTNGMGLAIADRAPRSVWRGEHFFRGQGEVSCISVPIFDSVGNVAGVLDASTASEDWHAHTMALLAMSASNIEAGLFHYEQQGHSILRVHPRPEYLPTLSAGLIALGQDGLVVAISVRGREILRVDGGPDSAMLDDILADPLGVVVANLMRGGSVACPLRRGGSVWISSDQLLLRQRCGLFTSTQPQKSQRSGSAALLTSTQLVTIPTESGFVANDLRIRAQLDALHRVVRRRVPVHFIGESGTGRESLARFVHGRSGRSGPFVAVNCAALSANEAVADLFGHVDRVAAGGLAGLVGAAHGGTLFLEDVDRLPPAAHASLLCFMDTGDARPVGQTSTIQLDVQVMSSITTTVERPREQMPLRNSHAMHLNAFAIRLPPLRDRTDIRDIIRSVLAKIGDEIDLAPVAMRLLCGQDWPGNIRELRATLNIATALCDDAYITPQDILRAIPAYHTPAAAEHTTVRQGLDACSVCRDSPLRRNRCIQMRETYDAQGRNAARTARFLGISRSTLYEHIKDLRVTTGADQR